MKGLLAPLRAGLLRGACAPCFVPRAPFLTALLAASFLGSCGEERGIEVLERSEDLSVESEAETPGPPEVPPGEARCDLLAQEGCGDAERCVPTLDAGTRCVAAGEGSEGEGCSRVAACAAGLLCAQEGPDEAGRCRRICGEGVPCDPGGRCVGSPGLRDAGLCLSDP